MLSTNICINGVVFDLGGSVKVEDVDKDVGINCNFHHGIDLLRDKNNQISACIAFTVKFP